MDPAEQSSMKSLSKVKHFHSRKCISKCRLEMAAILSRPQCVNDEMRNQFKSAFNRWPINMENNATFF